MRVMAWSVLPAMAIATLPAPVAAQTARDLLTQAAFQDRSQPAALARVDRARATALATAQRLPDDQDAAVLAAVALAYRAKLTGNRGEAIAARKQMETVVARFPRNAEALVGLGAWHLGVIAKVGRIMGRAGAGAQKGVGLESLDRGVALGGNRAMFAGLAGLLRIQADPADPKGRSLLETAVAAPTPTVLDRIEQKAANAVLTPLRQGDGKTARALANRLLPFGWYDEQN
ncbi:hypothetical protein ASG67_05030 [Sphingomonas sp. Leaf339]|uniref:hypothetical protein n=1 Tax=Sphingomonas sp. Leaf339 TaxID=1736343 RepID=UPI0006FEE39A|nr:hypothetical protein [Sphingomonas sp. Leaf339]KQU62449.1 hypothetical protein ASG67_05030 [Sphingomonas sp. Leaf339]